MQQTHPNQPNSLAQNITTLKGSHILLVEDNQTNQEIILGLLESSGIVIDIAANGQEAVDKYNANPQKYELILMDIQMPIMDGYTATSHIRQKDQDIAIVALSANAMKEDVERSHEVGMNSHLNKPIEVEKLYTTLLSYLSPKSDVSILSTSNQAEITIPPLDTIDTNIGNSYLAGNQKLYLKLLHDFKKDYQDFDIKTLDKESYKLKIHTLKGFSGSIGATKLYEICKKLEESQEEQYIEAFAKELQSILSELNDKLPNQPHNDNSANEPISETLKTELLNELKNTLELMEPQKCYTIIQKIEHYQLHSEDEKHFNRIKELIENYQFDEALELFENTKDDN